ncbi:AAA family ATPase [Pseudomonas gingeri]|nr:AAA family ATPase [Pseudomonas gingeri]
MYAKSLRIYAFKCFGRAELELQYPGRTGEGVAELSNVNLIIGNNGGGKSSVLRALAIAMLAPALLDSGFVPYRLVHRGRSGSPSVGDTLLKVKGIAQKGDLPVEMSRRKVLELLARLEQRGGSLDRLHLESTPKNPVVELLDDDTSPAFFVVGYGATRRVETGDYSPSSARRLRGLRYQRIASLFEDQFALRPIEAWLPRLKARSPARWDEVIELMNRVLPDNIRFFGEYSDDQYLFDFEGMTTPFMSLSDGYKSFIAWVSDLIGYLSDVALDGMPLDEVTGMVLVDEIDLHLHPQWQRSIVSTLADAFPRLQFIFTTHSALVAGTVSRQNVYVTDTAEDGTATVERLNENLYGRSVEQLLLSPYFGLNSTRALSFQNAGELLFQRAAKGDSKAALEYLELLAGPKPVENT